MRKELHEIFGEELRFLAIDTRECFHYTQKEMGTKLLMSESSYSDIETGKNYCGMGSAILLLEMQEDPNKFLQSAKEKAIQWYEKELQPV